MWFIPNIKVELKVFCVLFKILEKVMLEQKKSQVSVTSYKKIPLPFLKLNIVNLDPHRFPFLLLCHLICILQRLINLVM